MSNKESLRVKVLGCGDAFSSGGRRHTSFFIKKDDTGIMIDCGATTAMALKAEGISFEEVDYVLLTHFHGDHYGGLPFLILEAAKLQKRKKPLTLIAPPGLEEKLYQLLHLLYPGSEDSLKSFPIEYKSYSGGSYMDLPFGRLLPYEVKHATQTNPHGLRLELKELNIAYSGDTSWHDNLLTLAEDTALFICECNFFDQPSGSHIHYQLLKDKIKEIGSEKIVLTHLGENMLKNVSNLEINVLEDGEEIIL